MGRGTLPVVRDGSGDPPSGLARIGEPSQRSGMGWGTLLKVRDKLGHPPGGPGQVGTPSGRSRTG